MEKALKWRDSAHLDLVEELLAECGVPDAVYQLVRIMETEAENVWCSRYKKRTGKSERSFRRDRKLAEQLVACRQGGQAGSAPETDVA